MSKEKQKRYEYLRDLDEFTSDEQDTERLQIFYELHPEAQYWRVTHPDWTPQDIWGVDTSCYGK